MDTGFGSFPWSRVFFGFNRSGCSSFLLSWATGAPQCDVRVRSGCSKHKPDYGSMHHHRISLHSTQVCILTRRYLCSSSSFVFRSSLCCALRPSHFTYDHRHAGLQSRHRSFCPRGAAACGLLYDGRPQRRSSPARCLEGNSKSRWVQRLRPS